MQVPILATEGADDPLRHGLGNTVHVDSSSDGDDATPSFAAISSEVSVCSPLESSEPLAIATFPAKDAPDVLVDRVLAESTL